MAWETPRDWTTITDNVVTAAMLNADIRDNLNFLSVHTHTGAAGMGSGTLSAVTLASITTMTFADQSANPDAAGELQRNGANLAWYNGSAVITLTGADAAAGTPSLRSLGTSATTAAAGNHTHVPASPNQLIVDAGASINTDAETNVASGTIVVQNAASEALAVSAVVYFPDATGNQYTARLKFSGPSSGTIDTITGVNPTTLDIHPLPNSSSDGGIISPASAGTYTISVTSERTFGSTLYNPKATIYAREVGA